MSLSSLNSIGQTVFKSESGNEKCGRTDVGHNNLIGGLRVTNQGELYNGVSHLKFAVVHEIGHRMGHTLKARKDDQDLNKFGIKAYQTPNVVT